MAGAVSLQHRDSSATVLLQHVCKKVKFELKPPFSGGYNPANPASPYSFFPSNASAGTFTDDGVIKIRPIAVEVTATSFTKTLPLSDIGILDHPKFLAILKVPYGPPLSSPAKKVVLEIKASGRTYRTEANPFPSSLITDPNDDLRLATFGFVNVDLDNSMVVDFALKNKGIYAFYERLPFSPQLGPYKAFTQVKRVGNRVVNQWSSLKVVYDKMGGIVSWYLNNKVVFSVNKIGFISPDPGHYISLSISLKEYRQFAILQGFRLSLNFAVHDKISRSRSVGGHKQW